MVMRPNGKITRSFLFTPTAILHLHPISAAQLDVHAASSFSPDPTQVVTQRSVRRGTSTGVADAHLPYAPGKAPQVSSVATAETIMGRYPDNGQAYWKDWMCVQGYVLHGCEMLYRSTRETIYLEIIKQYSDARVFARKGN